MATIVISVVAAIVVCIAVIEDVSALVIGKNVSTHAYIKFKTKWCEKLGVITYQK